VPDEDRNRGVSVGQVTMKPNDITNGRFEDAGFAKKQ
jgi:hypothetical protein